MKITTPTGILEGENIEAILKKYGLNCLSGADLSGADLRGANLCDANLRDANLYGADLRGADLSGADLRGANLCDANLRGANLSDANLRGADLSDANLRGANLSDANLYGADLYGADLRGADLRGANLRGADLRGANLRDANLCDANLRGADLPELTIAKTSILPDGDIIGWKKAYVADMPPTPVIVKLLIPSDAKRSNSTGRKCRANKARILDLQDLQDRQGNSLPPDTTAYSSFNPDFTYRKGETVSVEDFDTDRWNECAPGIHFFITRIEAVNY